jgi:hypothetical protein
MNVSFYKVLVFCNCEIISSYVPIVPEECLEAEILYIYGHLYYTLCSSSKTIGKLTNLNFYLFIFLNLFRNDSPFQGDLCIHAISRLNLFIYY